MVHPNKYIAILFPPSLHVDSQLLDTESTHPTGVFTAITKDEKIAFGIIGGLYTLICLISLFGYVCSLSFC